MRTRNKIPQKAKEKAEQALQKGLRPVPSKLSRFIALANLALPECELPKTAGLSRELQVLEISPDPAKRSDWESRVMGALDSIPEQLPRFREYIHRAYIAGGPRAALRAYNYILRIRINFYSIIVLSDGSHFTVKFHLANPVELSIDVEGLVRIRVDEFTEALEGIEAKRIRLCEVCKRIFWAGRITQKCCSNSCSNKFRVHRFRYKTDEEKAAYELRRMRREEKRKCNIAIMPASGSKKGK
jgi:hypothetical protein